MVKLKMRLSLFLIESISGLDNLERFCCTSQITGQVTVGCFKVSECVMIRYRKSREDLFELFCAALCRVKYFAIFEKLDIF